MTRQFRPNHSLPCRWGKRDLILRLRGRLCPHHGVDHRIDLSIPSHGIRSWSQLRQRLVLLGVEQLIRVDKDGHQRRGRARQLESSFHRPAQDTKSNQSACYGGRVRAVWEWRGVGGGLTLHPAPMGLQDFCSVRVVVRGATCGFHTWRTAHLNHFPGQVHRLVLLTDHHITG